MVIFGHSNKPQSALLSIPVYYYDNTLPLALSALLIVGVRKYVSASSRQMTNFTYIFLEIDDSTIRLFFFFKQAV